MQYWPYQKKVYSMGHNCCNSITIYTEMFLHNSLHAGKPPTPPIPCPFHSANMYATYTPDPLPGLSYQALPCLLAHSLLLVPHITPHALAPYIHPLPNPISWGSTNWHPKFLTQSPRALYNQPPPPHPPTNGLNQAPPPTYPLPQYSSYL